jgi:dUTP pyrophosphatase
MRESIRIDGAGRLAEVKLEFRRLDPNAPLPRRAREGDAGLDLMSWTDVVLEPGERALVPTGLAVAIPPGHAGLVLPRSGLASRHGLTLANAPGLIDPGYRGEVTVALVNIDRREAARVRKGDRIAQLLVVPFADVEPVAVEELPETDRGAGGFGSTGLR